MDASCQTYIELREVHDESGLKCLEAEGHVQRLDFWCVAEKRARELGYAQQFAATGPSDVRHVEDGRGRRLKRRTVLLLR